MTGNTGAGADTVENTEATTVAPVETALQKKRQLWASLPPDSTHLLRLAPLTAERETGLRPLLLPAWPEPADTAKN